MPDGLTFVLPLRTVPAILGAALEAWATELKKLRRSIQILLVLDPAIVDAEPVETAASRVLGKAGLSFTILRATSSGFGAALREALRLATEPLLFYTSLDYPYTPADLSRLMERLETKDAESGLSLHLITGYRARTPMPRVRAALGFLWRGFLKLAINVPAEKPPGWLGRSQQRFRFWMRALFALRVGDVNSHFKLFRREIFQRIPLQSDGEFVHGEILAKANFLGCYMDEVPIATHAGPIAVPAEIPAVSWQTYRELRHVLKNPDFGPWPLETKERPPTAVDERSGSPEPQTI